MKLRIKSDGTPPGTHVYVVSRAGVEDELENVLEASWSIDVRGQSAARIIVNAAELDVDTERVQFVMDHQPPAPITPDETVYDVHHARAFVPEDAYAKYLRDREAHQ